jgi:hypothetical protein
MQSCDIDLNIEIKRIIPLSITKNTDSVVVITVAVRTSWTSPSSATAPKDSLYSVERYHTQHL